MKKVSKKLVIAGVVLLLTGSAITAFIVMRNQNNKDDAIGKTYLMSRFGDGNYGYSCSKEVAVTYRGSSVGPGAIYTPNNQEEFSKYCRSTGVY